MNAATRDREVFAAWLALMDDAIQAYLSLLPRELAARLDGSPQSLDALEAHLLARYATVAAARAESEASSLDGAVRYFGEVLRRCTGSHWDIDLGNPRSLFFGLPLLRGGRLPAIPACPASMVTTALDRRTGHFLRSIVERHQAGDAPTGS